MLPRSPAAVLTALLLLAAPAPALAQDPAPTPPPAPPAATPTPAPTPVPVPGGSTLDRRLVNRVYRDFRSDGEIEPCRHSQRRLERVRDFLLANPGQPVLETSPDFLPALEASLEEREDLSDRECRERLDEEEREEEDEEEDPEATPTPTPTPTPDATATPSPTVTPAPTTTPAPTVTPAPVPEFTPAPPAPAPDPGPAPDEEPTPAPPEETPTPTPTPTPSPTPEPTPAAPTVVERRDEDGPPAEVVLGAAVGAPLGLTGLIALLMAVLARLGIAETPRARARHAWGEAAYRVGGAWGDFVDWLRFGR